MPRSVVSLSGVADSCQVGRLAKASDDLTTLGRRCRYDSDMRCYLKGKCSRCRYGRFGDKALTSLDRDVSSSAVERGSVREVGSVNGKVSSNVAASWSRQQKRGYHRVLSCLQWWQSHGYQIRWVMLSTAIGGDKRALASHHSALLKRVERRGFPDIEHFQVRTGEGNGVLHVLWAWKPSAGFRSKLFWVGQHWLSDSWLDLHGARVVWIGRVGSSHRDVMQVARYCISQYVGNQSFYEYMSYSWKRSFGFPLVSCWRKFKLLARSFDELVRAWSRFLAGKVVWTGYGGFTLGSIRLGYQLYGKEFWDMLHWT